MTTKSIQDEVFFNSNSFEEGEKNIVECVCDGNGALVKCGVNGVTRIELYNENGQMSYVPWAAVYKGDFLFMRIDLAGKSVKYFDKREAL